MRPREQATCHRRDANPGRPLRAPLQAVRRTGRAYLGRALPQQAPAMPAQVLRVAAGLTLGALAMLAAITALGLLAALVAA